jgi:hypothetical protein
MEPQIFGKLLKQGRASIPLKNDYKYIMLTKNIHVAENHNISQGFVCTLKQFLS